jgi:ethanolamine utilization microcompartment shell protein EutS
MWLILTLLRNSIIQAAKIENIKMSSFCVQVGLMDRFGGKVLTDITVVKFAFKIKDISLSITFVVELKKRLSANNLKI